MAEAKKTTKKQKEAELMAETVNEEAVPEVKVEKEVPAEAAEPKTTAKAGKRSAKAARETEEKEAKEERKAAAKEEGDQEKPKQPIKPARTRAERAGKKYREAAKLVDRTKVYPLTEAVELAIKTTITKFDATVELHVNLGVDPKQADQNIRQTVVLPAGTGKDVRVATLSSDAEADKLFAKLDKEEIDFDVLVATPQMMPKLGKYARLLGPRGLMPNPKSGTVTTDVAKATEEAKAGRVEYRVDQAGIIHLGVGKVSFGADKLRQNISAVLESIRAAKPASLKGTYLLGAYISTTMGPSVKIEL